MLLKVNIEGLHLSIKTTLITLLLLSTLAVHSGDVYQISKSTIKASGGAVSGNGIEIKSSIGQADASNPATGGIYTINGGIWAADINNDIIFKNGFEN